MRNLCSVLLFLLSVALAACSGETTRTANIQPTPAASAAMTVTKTAVWIDTDPSISSGPKEVDDGFALIQAFHSTELDLRGVSVVFGNAPLKEAWPIGQDIVRKYGPAGMAIYAGAASEKDLGVENDATRAIAAALQKDKLTIFALGPVTNVATVVKNHPELHARIDNIIAVAGRRPGQHFITGIKPHTPFRDFNFELDAPGFQVLLDSNINITLAPWEVSSKVWMKAADLDALAAGKPATQWLAAPGRDWLKMWQEKFDADGFNPFDTLAIAYVTSPQTLTWEDLPAIIQKGPDDRAPAGSKAPDKPYLVAGKEIKSTRMVRYIHTPKPEFKADLLARLLR
ncbi:MAG: nucleoside hydrolase [Blastocatellia bacterium]